jgi:hypothetical protein
MNDAVQQTTSTIHAVNGCRQAYILSERIAGTSLAFLFDDEGVVMSGVRRIRQILIPAQNF